MPRHQRREDLVEPLEVAHQLEQVHGHLLGERGRAVKLALTDRRLTLSVNNPDSGSATEEIEVDYDASPLDIGFNARYLLDILSEIDGDTVEVHLADAAAPTLLRENDKSNALYVLMPMRV